MRALERAAVVCLLAPFIAVGSLAALRPGPSVDDGVSLRLPSIALPTAPPVVGVAPIQHAALSPQRQQPGITASPASGQSTKDASTERSDARLTLPPITVALAPPKLAQCEAAVFDVPARRARTFEPQAEIQALDPVAYGERLAAAARSQRDRIVIYDARYTRIAYPGGDVPSLYGVCTDVVIRAYRDLGTDLQAALRTSGLGRGDTSIDHRRTETLRRFFARHGESLPVTDDPDAFQLGDIVTYYRPQNRISTAHIAIVSSEIGPSGRLMIIHNRGNGVQEEDALFVDRMTGHYRYRPSVTAPVSLIAGRLRKQQKLAGRTIPSVEPRTTASPPGPQREASAATRTMTAR